MVMWISQSIKLFHQILQIGWSHSSCIFIFVSSQCVSRLRSMKILTWQCIRSLKMCKGSSFGYAISSQIKYQCRSTWSRLRSSSNFPYQGVGPLPPRLFQLKGKVSPKKSISLGLAIHAGSTLDYLSMLYSSLHSNLAPCIHFQKNSTTLVAILSKNFSNQRICFAEISTHFTFTVEYYALEIALDTIWINTYYGTLVISTW